MQPAVRRHRLLITSDHIHYGSDSMVYSTVGQLILDIFHKSPIISSALITHDTQCYDNRRDTPLSPPNMPDRRDTPSPPNMPDRRNILSPPNMPDIH